MAVLISNTRGMAPGLKGRTRRRPVSFIQFLMAVACFGMGLNVSADTPTEYQLKAVLLFNLFKFVEWPASAFDSPEAPFVLGIVGHDPFGPILTEVVRDEKVRNRPIVVEHYRSVRDVKKCHLLFISADEKRNFFRINSTVARQPVLTVADAEGFIQSGGLLQLFVKPDGKIGLQINATAAKAAQMEISSKLLQVAQIVSPDRN